MFTCSVHILVTDKHISICKSLIGKVKKDYRINTDANEIHCCYILVLSLSEVWNPCRSCWGCFPFSLAQRPSRSHVMVMRRELPQQILTAYKNSAKKLNTSSFLAALKFLQSLHKEMPSWEMPHHSKYVSWNQLKI